jgi:hypothetical protein
VRSNQLSYTPKCGLIISMTPLFRKYKRTADRRVEL